MKIPRLAGALNFIEHEASGGAVLFAAAVLAMIAANSAAAPLYAHLLETPMSVRAGEFAIDKSLLHWINDGLMAVFFFLVGLEIKRELLTGELSTLKQAALPAIAAAGGMLAPALIYIGVNQGDPVAVRGWAIPAATDIAFAVGVLALLGPRVPASLKIFLLALAIIDDLGAILIIAFFYTSRLSFEALALAGLGVAILAALNLRGVTRAAPYVLTGVFIWACVLKSGVHATVAGVVTALAIPLLAGGESETSPLERLEEELHNWVTFGVLPLFAFANAGVSLAGVTPGSLAESIPLGVALGLILGKPLGIFAFTWGAVRLGWGARPAGANWTQLLGVAMLGGIGFTMSLFIGMLAFPEPRYADDIRLGVLGGSIASAFLGYMFLRRVLGDAPPAAGLSRSGAENQT